jgi:alpha-tubulin suppressor-like RCC1 family protein
VACGENPEGQCDIPALAEGQTYTQAAAGFAHTVLLRSDGTAVACGNNDYGQCNIPALAEGLAYTHAAAGYTHTVLLRNDGSAVACGHNDAGECNIPALAEGLTYTQAAAGHWHTVLLRSDGTVVTCGWDSHGQCAIPALAEGLTYSQAATGGVKTILQSFFTGTAMTVSMLSGKEVCRIVTAPGDRLADVQSKLVQQMRKIPSSFDVVLPSGAILGIAILREPSVVLSRFLAA